MMRGDNSSSDFTTKEKNLFSFDVFLLISPHKLVMFFLSNGHSASSKIEEQKMVKK